MIKKKRYGLHSVILAIILAVCMLSMFACGDVEVVPGDLTDDTKYSVTISDDIDGGEVESSHAKTTAGTHVTLTVAPDSGYGLSSISYNNTAITADANGDYTFTMPSEDVAITAEFSLLSYDISIDSAIANGTITAEKTSSVSGATVTVGVQGDAGYDLVVGSLTYNGSMIMADSTGVYSFTMPKADVTITGEFAKSEFIVSVTGGTLVDGTTYGNFSGNDIIELVPVEQAGKTFDGWYELNSDGTTGSKLTLNSDGNFVATEAINIVGIYSDIVYTISVTGGTTDKASYSYGDTVVVTPNTISGQQFMYWETQDGTKIGGSGTTGVYSYVVTTEGDSFTAVFEDKSGYYGETLYSVSAFNLLGSGEYYEGETVTITFNSSKIDTELYPNYIGDDGNTYGVNGIKDDNDVEYILDNGDEYSFVMPAGNVEFEAIFGIINYELTSSDNVTGAGEYLRGDVVTLTYTTPSKFVVGTGWIDVNGVWGEAGAIVSTSTTFSFVMPMEDILIEPSCEYLDVTVSGIDLSTLTYEIFSFNDLDLTNKYASAQFLRFVNIDYAQLVNDGAEVTGNDSINVFNYGVDYVRYYIYSDNSVAPTAENAVGYFDILSSNAFNYTEVVDGVSTVVEFSPTSGGTNMYIGGSGTTRWSDPTKVGGMFITFLEGCVNNYGKETYVAGDEYYFAIQFCSNYGPTSQISCIGSYPFVDEITNDGAIEYYVTFSSGVTVHTNDPTLLAAANKYGNN